MKKKMVRVKEKDKKKGRSERPRIDKAREAIPREIDLIVETIDPRKPSVKLGAIRVREASVISRGIGGEGVDQVHEKESEVIFAAVKLFFQFF